MKYCNIAINLQRKCSKWDAIRYLGFYLHKHRYFFHKWRDIRVYFPRVCLNRSILIDEGTLSIICISKLPYPLECSPRVLFFILRFWVRFNSNLTSKSGLLSQKVRLYSRKTTKSGLFKNMGLYSGVRLHSSGYGR